MSGDVPTARGRRCPTGVRELPTTGGRSTPAAGGRNFLPPAAPPSILFLIVFCLFREIEMAPCPTPTISTPSAGRCRREQTRHRRGRDNGDHGRAGRIGF